MLHYVRMAREDWDDSESGGRACACGRACAERDYQGNAARGPRAFCDTDRRYIGRVIRQLPETYTRISFLLPKDGQQEERVSGSREAPIPVSTEPEAFMRHVILVATSWEEQVRAVASLSDPDQCRACGGDGTVAGRECRACGGDGKTSARDGVALQRACDLLGGHDDERTAYLDTLLSLEPEGKKRPVPGSRRLSDLEPGSYIVIDSSGDAWENRAQGGTDAGLEFLRLNGRARAMLGLNLQRRRVAVPCDGCDAMTLIQREALGGGWEPVIRCTNCPEVYIGQRFEYITGREYSATVAAQNQAS